MKPSFTLFAASSLFALVACGPAVQDGTGDDEGGADAGSCEESAEVCGDTLDNDCDGFTDCADVECFGLGDCEEPNANCGTGEDLLGSPLALPDGNTQTTSNTCTPIVSPGYTSALNFTGFSNGQVLEETTGILSVCVTMEHTWLRDLQMEIQCPSGATTVLHMFQGTNGGEVLMGVPNHDDEGGAPVPGTGYDYCWVPGTTNGAMIPAMDTSVSGTLPAGDYASSCTFDTLVGCALNGNWSIRVTDLWGIDNGFIFKWGVNFDPNIIEDCDNWPVP